MSLYKFKEEEIFNNSLRLYPKYEFTVYSGTVYINNEQPDSGSFNSTSLCVPSGYISLYEKNIDKLSGSNNYIYPFITKDGSLGSFASVGAAQFAQSFAYGDEITGSYPMSSSLYRNYYSASAPRRYLAALQNTMNFYKTVSPHYEFNGSYGDKGTQEANLISIPSILYGSSIKKGTVDLKFYITGTLVGQLVDKNRNGELIQQSGTIPANDGKVAGVVLYKEGFVLLTGSWDLHGDLDSYTNSVSHKKTSQWVYWGTGITGWENLALTASHSSIEFQGDNSIPTITMYAHAPKGQLNHSNNPSFIQSDQSLHTSSLEEAGTLYLENSKALIKNTVYNLYDNNAETFEKHTYITKIGIYDEYKNLIGVAKIAKPVKKTEDREFSFKLKLDI